MDDVLSPEDYEMLLALGGDNAALDPMITQQMEQAKLLREQGATPQGQMAGRVFVAPNVLQYAAALGNQYKAKSADKQMQDFQQQQLNNQRRQNEMVMRGIVGRGTGQQPVQPSQDPYARFRTDGGST